MTRHEARVIRDRLQAFIRQYKTGGCRMLSAQDEGCDCPLCDVDRLYIWKDLDLSCAETLATEDSK